MDAKTALVAGASGLVGGQLLTLLTKSGRYAKVTVISRSPLQVTHEKLSIIIGTQDDLERYNEELACDDVFCCLGTTMKKAGSREAFRKVDFEYPLALAKKTLKKGAKQYFLVSALGANSKSSIFYNKVKGEVEDAISGVGFKTLHILRPSLLIGPRKEPRLGEFIAKVLSNTFGFLLPKRYRGIASIKVARAMLFYASREEKGIFFHSSDELQSFTK